MTQSYQFIVVLAWADIQEHFDADFKAGTITKDEWYGNASDEGILAYKLLLQTGDTDNPVNAEQVCTQWPPAICSPWPLCTKRPCVSLKSKGIVSYPESRYDLVGILVMDPNVIKLINIPQTGMCWETDVQIWCLLLMESWRGCLVHNCRCYEVYFKW